MMMMMMMIVRRIPPTFCSTGKLIVDTIAKVWEEYHDR
jgi:hypothetical protein